MDSIKSFVVQAVDFLAAIVMVVAFLAALLFANALSGAAAFFVPLGIVLGSALSVGFWMLLSSILDVQRKILEKMEKNSV